jgi:hypothetical protein
MELHHLTPLGVLHIAAFVTLCEAYMGIEPHFTLWNHLFCARLLQGSGMEVTVLGGCNTHFLQELNFCPHRSAYKNAYQIIVHMKNFPKINLV